MDNPDTNAKETTQTPLLDRLRKSWFPAAAVLGAFGAFVAAALRDRPTPRAAPPPREPAAAPETPEMPPEVEPPPGGFEREYSESALLGGEASAHPFTRSLAGIAVGAGDRIYALGDGEVRVFEPDGRFVRSWKAREGAACLTADSDGRVYVGSPGRVDIYSAEGRSAGGFPAGQEDRPAGVTAIRVFDGEILVADASARFIRRYDSGGRQLGEIGTQNKTRSFILPNRLLDFDVDAQGVVRAADSGRHRVTSWALDGSPLGHFGKFGQRNPEDFTGCCNPINIAVTHDGKIVTSEKAHARVKVYEPDGKLLAVIGPKHFDPACTFLDLAADSRGRILAADPVRRQIKVFSLVVKVGVNEPFCKETACGCAGHSFVRQYDSLAGLLREAAGVEVRFTYYKLEDDLVDAVRRGEVDGVIAKAWTAIRAYRSAGAPCERLCDIPLPDGSRELTGVFIAAAEGEVRTIRDIAGRRLAMGRSVSYENSHAAGGALRGLGVEPQAWLEFAGCIQAAVSVLEGETDAAVVSNYCVRYGLDDIVGRPGAFRTLGETAAIPFVTFALPERIPAGVRARMKDSLLGSDAARNLVRGGLRPPLEWQPKELERA